MRARTAGLALAATIATGCGLRSEARPGDESDWAAFVAEADHAARYERFSHYLEAHGVAEVVPPWQLCRQGTDWKTAHLSAFAIPPEREWPHIVPTLRFITSHVVPTIGPVEVVSGYRTRAYNRRAGGARESRHLRFEAVDLVPRREHSRARLHRRLGVLWRGPGRGARVGLGLYGGTRFHIDTHRHRRW